MAKKYKINKMTLSKYINKYKINKNIIFYANFINHKYLQTKKKNYFEKNIYYLHQILIIIFIILYI